MNLSSSSCAHQMLIMVARDRAFVASNLLKIVEASDDVVNVSCSASTSTTEWREAGSAPVDPGEVCESWFLWEGLLVKGEMD